VLEYTEKGDYAKTELRAKFLKMRCLDKANIRDFLQGLRVKKEELVKVGVTIDDTDYLSTLISSLPHALSNFASAQLAAARTFSTSKTIDPDILISLLMEEADRQKAQRARRQGTGKGKDEEKDDALAVTPGSSKGKNGKGGGGGKKNVTCWNCGEKGHFKNKCPKPAKSKDLKEDEPAKSSAANAAESDSKGEGAWAIWDSDNDSSDSALFPDSDSDVVASITAVNVPGEDMDWFSEVAEDGCEADDEDWFTEESDDSKDIFMATDEAKPSLDGARTELYNSGCTQHISPCRDQFEKFQEIPPKAFCAANKQSFSAIGKGELVIDIPDGADVSQLRLMEVLYSPKVGYTLVSVGQLDDLGFTLTFGNKRCVIYGPDGEKVGVIPKNRKGLCRVEHEQDSAHAAVEALTLDQFHRRMGHISPKIAHKLVQDKFVTGVCLEHTPSGNPFFCESCVYA